MWRRAILAGVVTCSLALTLGISQSSNAQAQTVASSGDCDYWINERTGGKLRPTRLGIAVGNEIKVGDESFIWDPKTKSFINERTGGKLRPTPLGIAVGNQIKVGDESFVWVPCPPQTSMSGGYLGGELAKNFGRVKSTETSAATGEVTNQFDDSGDPFGGGLVAGWNFAPWSNNWVVGPFASFDWLHLTINHTFPGGTYLGTTTNWIANLGAKAGYMVTPNWQVYGLAGAAWVNQDLNLNFPAGFSTKNTTTPGFTLGLGTEYHASTWQVAGHPVSLFAQYQHTWYDTANFNTPMPASPGFNYAFKRDDDMLKFGVIVH